MFAFKAFVLLAVALVVVQGMPYKSYGGSPKPEVGLPGGFRPLDLTEAKDLLSSSFEKLVTSGGPKYSVVKVLSASRQVVAGFNTNIVAKVIEDSNGSKKNCNINILEPIGENTEISLKCSDNSELSATLTS